MGPFTTTSPRLWSGRRALTLGCLIHFLLLARWFMLDPQHTIPTFLSLQTLIQRLFHEHVYLFIAALCSQGAPLHRAKLLARFFPDCLSQTTCICPWPWLQLWVTSHQVSVLLLCPLQTEQWRGSWRQVHPAPPRNLPLVKKSLECSVSFWPCFLTLWSSVLRHTASSPPAVWKAFIVWCYWAEWSVFWGLMASRKNKNKP